MSDFNLNELISEVSTEFADLKANLNKDNLEIRTSFDVKDDDFLINADRENIKQTLLKITDNAIQHTKVGYIEIGYKLIKDKKDES